MITSIVLWSAVLILAFVALRRSRATAQQGVRVACDMARALALRLPPAILVGAFLMELVPSEYLKTAIGPESGALGIVFASIVGGLLPGGPFVSFPIAVAIYKAGAGVPQIVALLTAWSAYAIHRVLGYELPLMGGRFVAIRLGSSVVLPPLAGALAAAVVSVLPVS